MWGMRGPGRAPGEATVQMLMLCAVLGAGDAEMTARTTTTLDINHTLPKQNIW